MEYLVDYFYRECERSKAEEYVYKAINYGLTKYPKTLSLAESNEDTYRYVCEESKNMIKDIFDVMYEPLVPVDKKIANLEYLRFMYSHRFGYDAMFPILNIFDKCRAELGVDWRRVRDWVDLSIKSERLGFEFIITHQNHRDKQSPTIFRLTKSFGCCVGYEIVVNTVYSHDDLCVASNWAKARSAVLSEYKKYQEAVKNYNILEG